MFVLQGEKPVCLLGCEAVRAMKENSLCRHFDTEHAAEYGKISLQESHQISQKLKGGLESQQNIFTKTTAKNDAAVKAQESVFQRVHF